MAKCGSCGSNQNLMTADNLRAWVQPCGPGKDSPKYPAMCVESDRIAWPALEISNLVVNRKGAPTTIYRRPFNNPANRVAKAVVRAQPDDNTVDIQSDLICGGVPIGELSTEKFDIYLQNVCCGSGNSFSESWSGAVWVIRGVDTGGYTIPRLTTTGNDTEEELRIQFNNVTFDAFEVVTEVNFAEVAASAGLATGARVNNAIFYEPEDNCTGSSCRTCGSTYAAIADGGNLIYSLNGATPTEVQINAGAWATALPTNSYLAYFNGRMFATYSDAASGPEVDGFVFADVDDNGEPGTWTDVPVGQVSWLGARVCGDTLYMWGLTGSNSYIITVDRSGAFEEVLNTPATTNVRDLDCCGSQAVAVTDEGVIYKKDGCASTFSVIPSPAAVAGVRILAVGIRVEDEIWIGTEDGDVFCTQDCGQNWEQVNVAAGATQITAITWVDSENGWIVNRVAGNTVGLQSTWDGGDEWTDASPRINNLSADHTPGRPDVPCCTSTTSANNILIPGLSTGGVGQLLKGTTSAC